MDEFRLSEHKFWSTEGISVTERVHYTQRNYCTIVALKYNSFIIWPAVYIVACEKEMSWKEEGKQEKLKMKFYLYFDLLRDKCHSGA
jgi:hypothetical protein